MAELIDGAVFQEILDYAEPRAPLMHLDLEQPDGVKKAWACMVEVRFYDNLTCDLLTSYTIDPVSALLLLHRAGRFSVDGTLCDDIADFTSPLYDIVAAYASHDTKPFVDEPIPQAAPVTCSLADAIQFVIDAHKRVNGRELVVTIDGAHWSVK